MRWFVGGAVAVGGFVAGYFLGKQAEFNAVVHHQEELNKAKFDQDANAKAKG